MALAITHSTTATLPDQAGVEINKAEWNATHTLTGVASPAQGGTNSAYFSVAGPTSTRIYTFPDSAATILTSANAVTVAQGGTGLTAGTSGGVPYYSSTSAMTSSALLAQYGVMTGGGAAAAPYTTTGFTFGAATGQGLLVPAGTATTDVPGLSVTQTWNNAAIAFHGVVINPTQTALANESVVLQLGGVITAQGQKYMVTSKSPTVANRWVWDTPSGQVVQFDYLVNGNGVGLMNVNGTRMQFQRGGPPFQITSTDARMLDSGETKYIYIRHDGTDSIVGSSSGNVTVLMGTGAGKGSVDSTATVNTTAVSTTGAGPDNLQSYSLPLNSFSAAGKGVHITVWGTSANTAETKTIILYFGSTAILTNALTASIAGVWRIEADVFSTGTDTQDYVAQLVTTGTAGVALNDVEQGSSAQDDGAAIVIKCTGTIGAPSTAAGLVQEGMTVKFIN